MAEFRTSIIIDAKGDSASRVVEELRRKFGSMGDAARQSSVGAVQGAAQTTNALQGIGRQLTQLRSLFIAFQAAQGAVAGVQSVFATADAYTNLTARLRLVTSGQDEFNAAFSQLRSLADQSLAPLESVVQAFVRVSPAVKNLGGTFRESIALTEAVTTSLRISGATAQEQASALLQFAQGLSSNFQGDEFRALTETAPRLMQAVADGMGRNVTELKAMSTAGKLTADVVGNALIKSLQQLRSEAAGLPTTVSGAFTVLQNAALQYVGTLDQASGVSGALAQVIVGLSRNFKLLGDSLIVVAGAVAAIGFGRLVAALQGSIAATLAQVAANRAKLLSDVASAESAVALSAAYTGNARAALAEEQAKLRSAQASRIHAQFLVQNAEAAIANATGLTRLSLVTNQLIPAQQRLAASTAAVTVAFGGVATAQAALTTTMVAGTAAQNASTAAQATAAAAGSRVSLILRGIGSLFGGPVGIISLLGLAATAWVTFKNSGLDAVETLQGRVKGLRDNIQKLRDERDFIDSGGKAEPKNEDPAIEALKRRREELEKDNQRIVVGQSRTGAGIHDREIAQINERIAKSRELAAEEKKLATEKTALESLGGTGALGKGVVSREEATKGLQTRSEILKEFETRAKNLDSAFAEQIRQASDKGDLSRVKALEQEKAEFQAAAVRERDQALKGLEKQGAAGPQQRLPTLREEFDQVFTLTKDRLSREKEQLELSQKDQLISTQSFFAERRRIVDEEAQNEVDKLTRERTAQEKLITDLQVARTRTRGGAEGQSQREQIDDQVFASAQKVKEINAEIQVVQGRRLQEGRKIASEQAAAERELSDQLAQVQERLAEIAGASGGQEVRDRLLRQFRPLLDQLQQEGNEAGQQRVIRLVDAEANLAELRKLEDQFNAALTRMQQTEQSINIKREAGLLSESRARQDILKLHQDTAAELDGLVPQMEALAAAIPGDEAKNRIGAIKVEFERLKTVVDDVALAVNSALRDSFQGVLEDLSKVADGTKKLKDVVLGFFRSIEQAITKIAAQKVSDQVFGGQSTGGFGGWVSRLLGTSSSAAPDPNKLFGIVNIGDFHKGGIVGQDGRPHPINPLTFLGAGRHHDGGVAAAPAAPSAAGLAANEVPAILERGEEVLTRDDPRHRENAGSIPALLSKLVSVFTFHEGGIAGTATSITREVHPLVFAAARVLHNGGVVERTSSERTTDRQTERRLLNPLVSITAPLFHAGGVVREHIQSIARLASPFFGVQRLHAGGVAGAGAGGFGGSSGSAGIAGAGGLGGAGGAAGAAGAGGIGIGGRAGLAGAPGVPWAAVAGLAGAPGVAGLAGLGGIASSMARALGLGGAAGKAGAGASASASVNVARSPMVPGLAANEVPAVLLKGEEVLTRADPRHRENLGGGIREVISRLTSVFAFHGGGIAGAPTMLPRVLDPMMFAAAPRYHMGGIAGLDPNEAPTILQQGARTDTRSTRTSSSRNTTIVNIQTPDIGSFRRGRTQVQADIASAVARGKRNQ